jgi:hypothetical protein
MQFEEREILMSGEIFDGGTLLAAIKQKNHATHEFELPIQRDEIIHGVQSPCYFGDSGLMSNLALIIGCTLSQGQ